MKDKPEIQMTGVSQVRINKKWIWIVVVATIGFMATMGTMLVVSSMSRPATVNSGGYTNGEDW